MIQKQKTVSDIQNYFYQDGVLASTFDESGNKLSQNIIGANGNIISTERFGEDYDESYYGGSYGRKGIYNYVKDNQGSVTSVYNENGKYITGYYYEDFGETEEIKGIDSNALIPREGDFDFVGPTLPKEGEYYFVGPTLPQQGDPNFIGPVFLRPGDKNFVGPIRQVFGSPIPDEILKQRVEERREAESQINFDNEIRYTGGVYDESAGEYYLNARYYSPDTGNFISQDTYRGEKENVSSLNYYAYCGGNPVNYIDPTGHVAEGIQILWHYLYGKGKKLKKNNGSWGEYMKRNKLLRPKVQGVIFPIGKKLKKGKNKKINIRTSMEIENGESINGYQFLHGTNKNVGGFQIKGKISKNNKGQMKYALKYVWNDIMDPNPIYDTDIAKAKFAKTIPFANPKNFVMKISWSDISQSISNSNRFFFTGWFSPMYSIGMPLVVV